MSATDVGAVVRQVGALADQVARALTDEAVDTQIESGDSRNPDARTTFVVADALHRFSDELAAYAHLLEQDDS